MDWRSKVFDSLSLPALILKPDKVIVSANQMFLKQFEVTLDQIIGKRCHDFFYQSNKPCSMDTCPFPTVLSDKQGHSILRQVTTESGEERWEDRVFSPILNDAGEVEYIIEKVRDVTHVKVLEKELSGIKELMQKVIESSVSGIIVADLKGRILVMNPAARDLLGYHSEAEVKKITAEQLYPPGVAREIMKKLRDEKMGGKGKLPGIQISIVSADGLEIPVEQTAAIIYEGDREVATMGVFNDLRERVAAREKLKEVMKRVAQAEKMASVGQLAAGVAHEINNPLTGIMLYANMILERLTEDDPLREELKYVLEDVNRCRDIVSNLLAYSRQASPKKEIFHINALVEQSLSLIRDQRLFINVEIVKEMSSDMLLINADKNQLCQVVINLVMNAVDAMERKGVLTLRTYRERNPV